MMAVPLAIGSRRVAGIVMSEGYTLPRKGAAALERLITQPLQRKIPIIVGGQQDDTGRKDLQAWPRHQKPWSRHWSKTVCLVR